MEKKNRKKYVRRIINEIKGGTEKVREMQKEIIKTLSVKKQINPKEEIRNRIRFLKEYLIQTKMKGYILGISGGQDSTLAGKLAQMAVNELKNEGYETCFYALRLPYKIQKDEIDAVLALDFIQPDEFKIFNIEDTVDAFVTEYNENSRKKISDFHKGNVKARTRMMTQYAIAGEKKLLVIGTDHAAEAVTGFFTKYGDGGADILPLSGLTKRQGKQLLKELGAPEQLYMKKPTADLLDNNPGQSDEIELGISYEEIDDYLEGKEIDKIIAEKIEYQYKLTKHKRELPVAISDDWWEK